MGGKRYKYRVLNYKKLVTAIIILILINVLIIWGIVSLIKNVTKETSSTIEESKEKQEIDYNKYGCNWRCNVPQPKF